MCFHGNQLSWAIKHPVISLYLKYHTPGFICFPTILAPVISSLDEIYCIRSHIKFARRPFITAKFPDLDLKGYLPLASTVALEWNNRAGGKLQLKAETLPAS